MVSHKATKHAKIYFISPLHSSWCSLCLRVIIFYIILTIIKEMVSHKATKHAEIYSISPLHSSWCSLCLRVIIFYIILTIIYSSFSLIFTRSAAYSNYAGYYLNCYFLDSCFRRNDIIIACHSRAHGNL